MELDRRGCVVQPKLRANWQQEEPVDEVKPVAGAPMAEHREPYKSRGSRTVLGAPGGEIPPGDSTFSTRVSANLLCRTTSQESP